MVKERRQHVVFFISQKGDSREVAITQDKFFADGVSQGRVWSRFTVKSPEVMSRGTLVMSPETLVMSPETLVMSPEETNP